jgi:hypothetical protein
MLFLIVTSIYSIDLSPALSKPSFAPVIDNKKVRCVVGTEEQDPFKRNENRLIFFQV